MSGCRIKRYWFDPCWLEDAGLEASQKAASEAADAVFQTPGTTLRSEFRFDLAANVYEIEYAGR